MLKNTKLKIKEKKIYWNSLPWSETEYTLTSFQSCVFKTAQKKDTFSRKKLNFLIPKHAGWNLLALRKNSERKRSSLIFKKFLSKENSYLNVFFLEFLKFKKFQSSQRFKLAKIITKNPIFSKDLVQADLICYFLNSILLSENLLVFQALYNALNKSYSKKRYGQGLTGKEKIFSFFLKKLFKIFPNQKTFQAFQFYWILLLAKEEKVRFILQPEAQVLMEPNLLALRPPSFLNKSNQEDLVKHESLFCFQSFLNSNSCKAINDLNQHPFLSGAFQSISLKILLRKWHWFRIFLFLRKTITCNLVNHLSFRGFMRVRGSFINFFVKKKRFHFLKILCLQPFLLLGLDLDIKKWQQSKFLLNPEMTSLGKSFPTTCFFLATFEKRFLFFHYNGKFLSHVLNFAKDWLFFSFSHISFQFLFLTNLNKGLEIQNHCIKKKAIFDILPSKAYQKQFLESIKKICIQCRGKSSKFLIVSLISIFSSWQHEIFYNGHITSIKKIFRKIDSFLHFKLFRWARRSHPNWGRQKIVKRYFPKGGIWNCAMKKKVDNWVFCDTFNLLRPIFLKKLSWFYRKNFQKIFLLEFLFSGFF